MKRVKILSVPAELLVDLFLQLQSGEWLQLEGLPKDARVLSAAYDLQRMSFKILVESQEFPEVPPNAVPSEFDLTFRTRKGEWLGLTLKPNVLELDTTPLLEADPSHFTQAQIQEVKDQWITANPRLALKTVGPLEVRCLVHHRVNCPICRTAY